MIFTMKKTVEIWKYKMVFIFFLLMNTFVAMAQDGGTGSGDAGGASVTVSKTTSSSTTTQDWYTQPWVWIVGAIVFILLLIALIGGNSRSRTEVHRTVVHKDAD